MGMDVYGLAPTGDSGEYFRASIWSWSPLLCAMRQCCDDLIKGECLDAMAFNDGHGAKDQETCNRVASRLEQFLALHPEGLVCESSLRVDEFGRFVDPALNGADERTPTYSPYHADREMFQDWIAFLRHCGGFEVF